MRYCSNCGKSLADEGLICPYCGASNHGNENNYNFNAVNNNGYDTNPNAGNPNYGNPNYGNPNYGNPNNGAPNYSNPNYGNPNNNAWQEAGSQMPYYGNGANDYQKDPNLGRKKSKKGGKKSKNGEKKSKKKLVACIAAGVACILVGVAVGLFFYISNKSGNTQDDFEYVADDGVWYTDTPNYDNVFFNAEGKVIEKENMESAPTASADRTTFCYLTWGQNEYHKYNKLRNKLYLVENWQEQEIAEGAENIEISDVGNKLAYITDSYALENEDEESCGTLHIYDIENHSEDKVLDNIYMRGYCFSPDGTKLLYAAYNSSTEGKTELFQYNIKEDKVEKICENAYPAAITNQDKNVCYYMKNQDLYSNDGQKEQVIDTVRNWSTIAFNKDNTEVLYNDKNMVNKYFSLEKQKSIILGTADINGSELYPVAPPSDRVLTETGNTIDTGSVYFSLCRYGVSTFKNKLISTKCDNYYNGDKNFLCWINETGDKGIELSGNCKSAFLSSDGNQVVYSEKDTNKTYRIKELKEDMEPEEITQIEDDQWCVNAKDDLTGLYLCDQEGNISYFDGEQSKEVTNVAFKGRKGNDILPKGMLGTYDREINGIVYNCPKGPVENRISNHIYIIGDGNETYTLSIGEYYRWSNFGKVYAVTKTDENWTLYKLDDRKNPTKITEGVIEASSYEEDSESSSSSDSAYDNSSTNTSDSDNETSYDSSDSSNSSDSESSVSQDKEDADSEDSAIKDSEDADAEDSTLKESDSETADSDTEEATDEVVIQGQTYKKDVKELYLGGKDEDGDGVTDEDGGLTDEDIEALQDFTELEVLNIDNNIQITNLEPLKNMTNLKELYLGETSVKDLSPLMDMTNLEKLDLDHLSEIEDYSVLSYLTSLKELLLRSTDFKNSDMEYLEGLTDLTTLSLRNTKISNLEPLKKLSNLSFLYVSGVENITEKQVKDLKNSIGCKVEWE